MTTPGGFAVDPEDLDAQARDLRTFAENIRGAKAAAANTTTAFGAIGMTWSWALDNWTDDANGFADSAADAADRVAEELKNMARDYRDAEDTATSNMRRAGGDQP